MLPEQIYLVDSKPELVEAWSSAFSEYSEIIPVREDYFKFDVDAMVSPANSFGYMDGGLDRAILYELGEDIQNKVQSMIVQKYHGEIPVGCAEIIQTDVDRWPYLVVAPTMRVPEIVSETMNAYLSFKAILLSVARFNHVDPVIRSIVCPGLGAGIGGYSPAVCASQMHLAYSLVKQPARVRDVNEIYTSHEFLTSNRNV